MKQHIKIHYTFNLDHTLKISAGYGRNSFIDASFRTRRNANDEVIFDIAGTTVKGKIRTNFEKIAHLHQVNSDDVFGKNGQAGWVHISNLTAKHSPVVALSTSTAVDRYRKSAKQHALRVEEYIQFTQDDSFHGTIEGFCNNASEQYALLLALLMTNQFGGDKSTGHGFGKIAVTRIVIDPLTAKKEFYDITDDSLLKEKIYKHFTEGGSSS